MLKLHERQDALGLDYYGDNSHPFLEMTADFLAVIEATVAIIFSQTQPTAVVA